MPKQVRRTWTDKECARLNVLLDVCCMAEISARLERQPRSIVAKCADKGWSSRLERGHLKGSWIRVTDFCAFGDVLFALRHLKAHGKEVAVRRNKNTYAAMRKLEAGMEKLIDWGWMKRDDSELG